MIVNRDNLIRTFQSVYPLNQVEPGQLSVLADKTEVVFFKSRDMIYLEGASAKYLYILFEGEVEVLKEERQNLVKKNHLYAGDLLGEDVLTRKQNRRTSARALEDTLLIRISLPVLSRFIQSNGKLRTGFQFIANCYEVLIRRGSRFDFGREAVYYIGQPHRIYLVMQSALLFLLAALLIGATFYLQSGGILSMLTAEWIAAAFVLLYGSWFAWNFLNWANDLYIFTDSRVINQEQGIFLYEGREETPMDMIVSLSSRANFLGRQYGFGDLFIKTFTGSLRMKNVPHVEQTRAFLDYLIEKNRANKRKQEKKDFAEYLNKRKGYGQEEGQPFETEEPSRAHHTIHSTSFFQRLLGLKQTRGDMVIYRTHWLFLVRKTIFPFLILACLSLLWVYMRSVHSPLLNGNFIPILFTLLITGSALWWLYQCVDWRNDQYIITPDQLIDVYRKPLGSEDRRTAPLENIQSVRYQRLGILGLLLNFGTVFVKVGNEDFTFDNVYKPLEIQQTLFAYLEQADLIEKRAALAEQQRQMLDWMDTYQQFNREHPEDGDQPDK